MGNVTVEPQESWEERKERLLSQVGSIKMQLGGWPFKRKRGKQHP